MDDGRDVGRGVGDTQLVEEENYNSMEVEGAWVVVGICSSKVLGEVEILLEVVESCSSKVDGV